MLKFEIQILQLEQGWRKFSFKFMASRSVAMLQRDGTAQFGKIDFLCVFLCLIFILSTLIRYAGI